MASEALLRAACERAFSVARDGYEADPSIEPPEAMRSFLYVARLPRRALTIAQKAVENDQAFRARVAQGVTAVEVGKAGYIWLARPDGWSEQLEKLTNEAEEAAAKQPVAAQGVTGQTPTIPPPPGFEPGQFGADSENTNGGQLAPASSGVAPDDFDEGNTIEHELSSLRGLVDRLASERKPLSDLADTDAEPQEVEGLTGDQDSPAPAVESRKAARVKTLDQLSSELDRVIADRDDARRKHSESLTQQLELEKELSKLRDGRKDIDSAQVESDNKLVESRKELARITANRDEAERQRQATLDQMTVLNKEITTLRGEVKASAASRAQLEEKVADLHSKEQKVLSDTEQSEMRSQSLAEDNADLKQRLGESEQEIERLRVELDGFADLGRKTDTLQGETEELGEELARERQKSEARKAELEASREEVATLKHQVVETKTDHDGVAEQVVSLQQSLAEALADLGESRLSRDADRVATMEYRTERDELKVELARLQEIDSERVAKLDELVAEQSEHASLRERSADLEERVVAQDLETNKLKSDLTRIISERDKATKNLDSSTAELETLRAEAKVARQESDVATSALARAESSLEEMRIERETLATQLAESERRSSGLEAQSAKHQEQLTEALSNLGTIQLEIDNQRVQIESGRAQLAEETKRADEYKISSETHEKNLLALQEENQNEGDESERKLKALKESLEASKAELTRVEAEAKKAQSQLDSVRTNLRESEAKVLTLRGELVAARERSASHAVSLKSTSGSADHPDTQEVPASVAKPRSASDNGSSKDHKSSDISDGSGVASLIRSAPATGEVPLSEGGLKGKPKDATDDELDELSNIISKKLTSFTGGTDPSKAGQTDPSRDGVMFFGERGSSDEEGSLARPPSVFSTGELASIGEDSDVTFQPISDAGMSAVSPLTLPSKEDPKGSDAAGSADRRTVDIPADVAKKGGVELARFVVEYPEIVLLVDGDGVAKMGWSSRTVGEQREALVSWLADLTASTGASSDVVFDGRIGDDAALPASRVVSIRLSTPPTEPAAALDELIDAYPPQFPIAVVSDNSSLKDGAEVRGAVALSNAQLLDLFTPE